MRRTTPIALRVPPLPNANPMKLAQTLHPAHVISRLKVFHANYAFLWLAVFGHAVLLRRFVDGHASRFVRCGSWAVGVGG